MGLLSVVSEGRKLNGSLSLTFGPKRIEAIWDLPLVDLRMAR